MCRSLVARVSEEAILPEEAPPELRALFQDWLEEIEGEAARLWPNGEGATVEEVAARLAISAEGAAFLLGRLTRHRP